MKSGLIPTFGLLVLWASVCFPPPLSPACILVFSSVCLHGVVVCGRRVRDFSPANHRAQGWYDPTAALSGAAVTGPGKEAQWWINDKLPV